MSSTRGLSITPVMPGAELIGLGELQLALGFPEEVLKAWLAKGLAPTAWLIPDRRCHEGHLCWALEFPLYHALFVRGLLGRGQRLPVIVEQAAWPDVLEYLRVSLLGLEEAELVAAGTPPARAAQLAAEARHLAPRLPDGRLARLEDLLEPVFFDAEGLARLGPLTVKRHGQDTWSFYAADGDRIEEHRLAPPAPDAVPYTRPLAPVASSFDPAPFELLAVGTSHGFDPAAPCTSLVAQAGGRTLLIDPGPCIEQTLRAAGVSLGQLGALVVTHAHEDHAAGLSALLDLPQRLRLFASAATIEILRRKLALLNPQVNEPRRLLDDTFDLVPVEPDQEHHWYDLRLAFHYTLHPVPCTGVELTVQDQERTVSALIVGDHASGAVVRAAAAQGVLPPQRVAELEALATWRGALLVADAGAGPIHGVTDDWAASPAAERVFVHCAALPPAVAHRESLAQPGHRWTLVAEHERPASLERGLATAALTQAFPEAAPEWRAALLDAGRARSLNPGQVLLRQGEAGQDLFVVLSGELVVLAEEAAGPRAVAVLRPGDLCGEMALIRQAPRSATVRARCASRLLRIGPAAFERFARAAGLRSRLPELWQRRQDLQRVALLARSGLPTVNALAQAAVRRSVPAGSTLIRERSSSNTVYVLVAGRVQVFKADAPLMAGGAPVLLGPGAIIGETAPFLRQARSASIVTLDECEVLALRGEDFKRIVQGSPQLFAGISAVVAQRRAA